MLKLFTNDPEFSPRLAKKRAPYFPCAAFPWGPATHDTPDWSNRIPPRLGGRFDAVKKLGTIFNNNCMRTKSLTKNIVIGPDFIFCLWIAAEGEQLSAFQLGFLLVSVPATPSCRMPVNPHRIRPG